ncbi:MAG: integron integrase [Desulfobacteraceae bacterium]|nr:integron integrase [Desulfobacteraceae bacterium]
MENQKEFQTDPSLKLMERVKQALAYYQYSYRTEQSYCRWIKEYISFLGKRNVPQDRFQKEIGSFLDFLTQERKLSGSSQKQALNAIVFLYKRVFDVEIEIDIEPSKIRRKLDLPVVLTQEEVKIVLSHLKGRHLLMAQLLYGSGLRLMECLRLRIQHLDFEKNTIQITPLKKGRQRSVMLPKIIWQNLFDHVEAIRTIHKEDLAKGYGQIDLSDTLEEQFDGMGKQFICQYVFPSKKLIYDERCGMTVRSNVHESGLQKAVKLAVKRAGIQKKVSCNTFRHSFATHMLENNVNIYMVKDLMGHSDIKVTELYIHVMEKKRQSIQSPLDML